MLNHLGMPLWASENNDACSEKLTLSILCLHEPNVLWPLMNDFHYRIIDDKNVVSSAESVAGVRWDWSDSLLSLLPAPKLTAENTRRVSKLFACARCFENKIVQINKGAGAVWRTRRWSYCWVADPLPRNKSLFCLMTSTHVLAILSGQYKMQTSASLLVQIISLRREAIAPNRGHQHRRQLSVEVRRRGRGREKVVGCPPKDFEGSQGSTRQLTKVRKPTRFSDLP